MAKRLNCIDEIVSLLGDTHLTDIAQNTLQFTNKNWETLSEIALNELEWLHIYLGFLSELQNESQRLSRDKVQSALLFIVKHHRGHINAHLEHMRYTLGQVPLPDTGTHTLTYTYPLLTLMTDITVMVANHPTYDKDEYFGLINILTKYSFKLR